VDAGLPLFFIRQIQLSVLSLSFFQKSNMIPILELLELVADRTNRGGLLKAICPLLNRIPKAGETNSNPGNKKLRVNVVALKSQRLTNDDLFKLIVFPSIFLAPKEDFSKRYF
ncbi:MAG: hypothetical protein V7K38_10780, partial [Nostoc sp.]|uniref:hypothetical protein n=1 Tax=Nostoc sp. TaxID=1180 RepID=UPI002FFA899C